MEIRALNGGFGVLKPRHHRHQLRGVQSSQEVARLILVLRGDVLVDLDQQLGQIGLIGWPKLHFLKRYGVVAVASQSKQVEEEPIPLPRHKASALVNKRHPRRGDVCDVKH